MSLREKVSEAICGQCYQKTDDCIRLKKYEWCKKPGYWNYAMTSAVLTAVAEEFSEKWLEEQLKGTVGTTIETPVWLIPELSKTLHAKLVELLGGSEGT